MIEVRNQAESLISVIMPTYNYAQFIGEAINSVLGQNHCNIELIVIDNFSQDSTEQVVKSFDDSRVKYYKFFNPGIIAASRNFGIRKAHGEYIAFIDSDDIWFPNKLYLQLEYLRRNPDVNLVFCSLKIKGPDKRNENKIITMKGKKRTGYIYNKLLNSNFISCSSVMARASILNGDGYFDEDTEVISVEDWDLWLRIARKHKIAYIPDVLGIYRVHSSNQFIHNRKLQKIFYVINKHLKNGWISQRQANRAMANFYFRDGWDFIDIDVKKSRLLFCKALCASKGNPVLCFVSILGLFLSALPLLGNLIKKAALDKRIGNWLFNPQNL